MCGRVVTSVANEILETFGVHFAPGQPMLPGFTVKPTDSIPIVVEPVARNSQPSRRLAAARWSLTPPWATPLRGGLPRRR